MFGIGIFEFVVIGLIIIIFVKPEDLPRLIRQLANIYQKVKYAYRQIIRDLNIFDAFNKD